MVYIFGDPFLARVTIIDRKAIMVMSANINFHTESVVNYSLMKGGSNQKKNKKLHAKNLRLGVYSIIGFPIEFHPNM